jgi:phosphoesterase domain protein
LIYFTSDLHFGHNGINRHCPKFRPEKDALETAERLVEEWNAIVTPKDIVYDMGDFTMDGSLTKVRRYASRLNGEHHLILGNHDDNIAKAKDELTSEYKLDGNKLFESIQNYLEIDTEFNGETYQLRMFHYPVLEWRGCHKGSFMLCGHIHQKEVPHPGKILNVGYDLHGKIISLEEVIALLKDRPLTEHHNIVENREKGIYEDHR